MKKKIYKQTQATKWQCLGEHGQQQPATFAKITHSTAGGQFILSDTNQCFGWIKDTRSTVSQMLLLFFMFSFLKFYALKIR